MNVHQQPLTRHANLVPNERIGETLIFRSTNGAEPFHWFRLTVII